MSKNKKLAISLYLPCLILAIWFLSGCASVQSPQGGPKDSLPPTIVKMEPKNLSLNFNSKKIVLEFDEYVKLQNQFKEFSISPEQERPPILKERLKRLEITLQDSL